MPKEEILLVEKGLIVKQCLVALTGVELALFEPYNTQGMS